MILNYCSIGPSLSIQKRKSKKFLRTMGASISFFLLRGGGGYGLRRGFILAHYDIVITVFVASSTWCWHWWSHWVECLDQAALHSMWCALIKLKPGPDRWGPSMLNFQLACWQMRELVHIHSMSTRSSNSRSMWSPVSVSWVVILAHYDIVITFLLLNYHS